MVRCITLGLSAASGEMLLLGGLVSSVPSVCSFEIRDEPKVCMDVKTPFFVQVCARLDGGSPRQSCGPEFAGMVSCQVSSLGLDVHSSTEHTEQVSQELPTNRLLP